MDHMIDDADRPLPLPPEGHPLHELGKRLAELLDEDQWAQCEALLLEGWDHDRIDRNTGEAWRTNASLEVWFPITAERMKPLTEKQAQEVVFAHLRSIGSDQWWRTLTYDHGPYDVTALRFPTLQLIRAIENEHGIHGA